MNREGGDFESIIREYANVYRECMFLIIKSSC